MHQHLQFKTRHTLTLNETQIKSIFNTTHSLCPVYGLHIKLRVKNGLCTNTRNNSFSQRQENLETDDEILLLKVTAFMTRRIHEVRIT